MDFRKPTARGISLVELLTVVAIVGITLSFATPSFRYIIDRNNLSTSANKFISIINLARSESVNRNLHTVICPSMDGIHCHDRYDHWETGYLLFVDSNGNREHDSFEAVIHFVQDMDSINISTTRGRKRIVYHPSGWAAGSNMTIRFCSTDSGSEAKITISNSGRVRKWPSVDKCH